MAITNFFNPLTSDQFSSPSTPNALKKIFIQNNLFINPEWIEQCSEFIKNEYNPPPQLGYFLKHLFHQLCFSDLREIRDDSSQSAAKLFRFVQLMDIVDVSQSIYSQLQNIRQEASDPNNETRLLVLDEPQESTFVPVITKRCLKLEFTDGYNNLTVVEIKPLPLIDSNAFIGSKWCIRWPLPVVNGACLISCPDDICLVGGNVSELYSHPGQRFESKLNYPVTKRKNWPSCIDESCIAVNNPFETFSANNYHQQEINSDDWNAIQEMLDEDCIEIE